ncbi:type II secretion system F family protein [Planctomicrobium sp. SH668]|uniref:type II secretion system F family protein n=1 Tax=Planctomicrobium sp. SH668 TaxID=3448126 RepID=UPI003F5CAB86
MFQSQASLVEMARLSRNLGVSLQSGIHIVKAFDIVGRKSTGKMKTVLSQVVQDLKNGSDVTSALVSHGNYFPELFLGMIQVGEVTGALPEVFKALGLHYENNIRLKREFLGQITMPVVQLVAAIFIVAALIALLGWIGQSTGTTFDILGWGLVGTTGALIWLGGWALLVAAVVVGYKFASASLAGLASIHRFVLKVPVVGHCLRSFAIARFAWAFHLTQNSGMPIGDSIDSSLRATSNGAFLAATPNMVAAVQSGESLTDAFQASGLFPVEFIEFVMVAEQSGTVPEALDRMSPQFEEDARRSLHALASGMSWLVWGGVALFIITIIFTVALWYIGMIDAAMKGII